MARIVATVGVFLVCANCAAANCSNEAEQIHSSGGETCIAVTAGSRGSALVQRGQTTKTTKVTPSLDDDTLPASSGDETLETSPASPYNSDHPYTPIPDHAPDPVSEMDPSSDLPDSETYPPSEVGGTLPGSSTPEGAGGAALGTGHIVSSQDSESDGEVFNHLNKSGCPHDDMWQTSLNACLSCQACRAGDNIPCAYYDIEAEHTERTAAPTIRFCYVAELDGKSHSSSYCDRGNHKVYQDSIKLCPIKIAPPQNSGTEPMRYHAVAASMCTFLALQAWCW